MLMHNPRTVGLVLVALLMAFTGPRPMAVADPPGDQKPANRLARETSPYLLLHAHNPVDWYPWGPEAFAKAKAENKPIFLSVGYSSCYWCHVMERESFEDAEIAKFLNEHFVCIKVDREERPDVDQIYMTALQAIGPGGGGWPMSMFLTPDGRPFFGGDVLPAPRSRGFDRVPRPRHRGVEGMDDRSGRDRKVGRYPHRRGARAAPAPTTAGKDCRSRGRWADRGARRAGRAVRPRVRRVRLQPPEPPPAQVPRAGQPGLPARSAHPPNAAGTDRSARATPWRWSALTLDRMARGRNPRPPRPAAITGIPRTGPGPCRTSRRCSTTTPSSPRVHLTRFRGHRATRDGAPRPRRRSRSSSGA